MLKHLKKHIDKFNKVVYEQNRNINKDTRNIKKET